MTLGDMIEGVRTAFGGASKDERELTKLKEALLSLQDLRAGERKKKEALDRLIKDKQAELKVTPLKQNQISLAKEILRLKGGLDQLQRTEDEVSSKIDVAEALIAEKEREINAKKSAEAGITVDRVDSATDKRKDRAEDEAELNKAMEDLAAAGGQVTESAEDTDALLAAAMSSDTITVKPTAAKADPDVEAMIAAAATPTSAPSAEPAPSETKSGVVVAN